MEALNERRGAEHVPAETPEQGSGFSAQPELRTERQERPVEPVANQSEPEVGIGEPVTPHVGGARAPEARPQGVAPAVGREALNRFISDIVHGNQEVDVTNVADVQAALMEPKQPEE